MKKLLLLSLSVVFACDGPAPPLGTAVATGGPRVRFDLEARPLPEIPLPNDVATRLDPTSPTGRRLNVSAVAPTRLESRTRRKFAELDGFATYAPITVSFDAPLDLSALLARHRDNVDFRDDAVFLLNVDRRCERFGEEVALDFGSGRFPITLFHRAPREPDPVAPGGYRVRRSGLFTMDGMEPHGTANNLLFEEENEDRNGNGRLDPGEDVDDDGQLDVANFLDPRACEGIDRGAAPAAYDRCVADHLLGWYERETNTLLLRPIWPLQEGCTHAVVLTRRLTDTMGRAIESPFSAIHHRDQREVLSEVGPLLERYGLGLRDVSFMWSFTTGHMRKDLEDLRAGLYGQGPYASLSQEFPLEDGITAWRDKDTGAAILPGSCTAHAISRFWRVQGEWTANRCALEADMAAIAGLFGGSFRAPNLLIDKDDRATPRYPDDQDESWSLSAHAGQVVHGSTDVSFWCALPYERADAGCEPGNPSGRPFCRPFPVILFAHGYGGSRAEIASGHIGRTTAMGYAMCALDAFGHGLNRLYNTGDSIEAAFFRGRLETELTDLGLSGFDEALLRGRDRDLDNDGAADPGGDMWTSDVFHTRDMVRQTVLEHLQFVRLLRGADGAARDRAGGLIGDVDGDGRVDLGGPSNTISMWGISLGGIIAGVTAGAEPSLDAASPNAGGAGLVDVVVRSSQAGVPEAVLMPVMGPFLEGCIAVDEHDRPTPPGQMGRGCFSDSLAGGVLEWGSRVARLNRTELIRGGQVEGVTVGDEIRLINQENHERAVVHVSPHGTFRISVAADAMAPLERRRLFGRVDLDTAEMVVTPDQIPAIGDRLLLEVSASASGALLARVESFPRDVSFMGTRYPAGLPLVALQEGFGLPRNSPRLRRFMGLAAHAIGPADPASWVTRIREEPPPEEMRRGHRTHLLAMPTAGDAQVPVNTGIAMARVAGVLGSWRRDPEHYPAELGWRQLFAPDPRLGESPDALLLRRFVIEGDPRLERFADNPLQPRALFDVDDTSDGQAAFSCGPSDWSAMNGESLCPEGMVGQELYFRVPRRAPALRWSMPRADGGFDAIRVPILRPAGQHGIYNAQPFRRFDNDAYMVNFTTRFLGSRGTEVAHVEGCDCSASAVPQYLLGAERVHPSIDRLCEATDLKLCSPSCAERWGIRTPDSAVCGPSGR